jgi:hypothetical protein
MSLYASMFWDVLTAAGGTVALALIVVLALGINAMTLLFAGSAVVALERFARAARRWQSVAGFGLLWSGVLGAGAVYLRSAELATAPLSQKLVAWAAASAGSAVTVAVAIGLTRLALARVSPSLMAGGTLAVLGLGVSAVLGASGRIVYAASPAVVAAASALLLALRRRRRSEQQAAGDAENMLKVLAGALSVGVLLAAFVPAPEESIAGVGVLLLAIVLLAVVLGLIPTAAAGIFDSRLTAEWFIAVRYLLAKRRQTFISIITGICVVGIAAGVWLIITVLSVMNGFERTWRDEIIGNRAHFTVHSGLGPIEEYREVLERAWCAGTAARSWPCGCAASTRSSSPT